MCQKRHWGLGGHKKRCSETDRPTKAKKLLNVDAKQLDDDDTECGGDGGPLNAGSAIAAEIIRLHTEKGMGKKLIARTLEGANSKMVNAVLSAYAARADAPQDRRAQAIADLEKMKTMPLGTRVELLGLRALQLNGARGVVASELSKPDGVVAEASANAGRVTVGLDIGRTLAVKLENLKLVTEDEDLTTKGIVPSKLPAFEWTTQQGKRGKGSLFKAIESMFSVKEIYASNANPKWSAGDPFSEAQTAILHIVDHFQNGASVFVCQVPADTVGLTLVLHKKARMLPNGEPAVMCDWVCETKADGPSETTIALLNGNDARCSTTHPTILVKCSVAEVTLLKEGFVAWSSALDPKWRQAQNKQLRDGYHVSFLSLLRRPLPPDVGPDSYTPTSRTDRFMDITIPDLSVPLHTYGKDEDDCVICMDQLGNAATKALPRCGHRFHRACIDDWFSKAEKNRPRICPTCKQERGDDEREGLGDREGMVSTLFSLTVPRQDFAKISRKDLAKTDSARARDFKKNVPFVMKFQLSPSLVGPAQRADGNSPIMMYDQAKRLSVLAAVPTGHNDAPCSGKCTLEGYRLLMGSVRDHGTGIGEQGMTENVRGYCQAVVLSRDRIRVYVDRVFSRQPW